jgi:hypothetical protein
MDETEPGADELYLIEDINSSAPGLPSNGSFPPLLSFLGAVGTRWPALASPDREKDVNGAEIF